MKKLNNDLVYRVKLVRKSYQKWVWLFIGFLAMVFERSQTITNKNGLRITNNV